MFRRISRACRWAGSAALVGLFVLVALRLVGVVSMYSVQSGSMWPTLPVGALVVSVPRDASEIAVGDVVTVSDESGRVTHRVVASEHSDQLADSYRLLTLRGDNNRVDDPAPYMVDRADTMVFSVPWVGTVIEWLDRGANRLAVITGVTGCILVRSGLKVRGRRRADRAPSVGGTGGGVHAAVKVSV